MRLRELVYLYLNFLAFGLIPSATLAETSCPEMNDRHFGLHMTQKGNEAIFQTIGEYAQNFMHWNGTSTLRPILANFASTTLVPIPVDTGANSEVKEILSQLYQIGFFVNLDLSKSITLQMAIPNTSLNFKLNQSASKLSITNSNSQFINFTIDLALENLELKFPTLEICKDTYITKEKIKKCAGESNILASNVGLRVAPTQLVHLNLNGTVDLREGQGNKISLVNSNFITPSGSRLAMTRAGDWDSLQDFSNSAVAYNIFVDPNIKAPALSLSISGDGMEGSTSYGFNNQGAVKLIGKFLVANFKGLISKALPPVEDLVKSFISNFLEQNAVKAQLKYQLSRGEIEKSFDTLSTSSYELSENECIDTVPNEKGMAVYQFLAQMISGVSVKSKLARVVNGPSGGQSLFFDNEYLLLTTQDSDQSLDQEHLIPEYAQTAENNCVADPQILRSDVQQNSALPAPDSYHFAINSSEKTWNTVLANLSSSGIISGLLKTFTNDSAISLSTPKVRFKRLNMSDTTYLGSIYVLSQLYIDFSTVSSNAAIKISNNLNWNFFTKETWNAYLSFYGAGAEIVTSWGNDIGVIPVEIRLDLHRDTRTGKIFVYAHSLFDEYGYFKNELGQYTNQRSILGPVLDSIRTKFSVLESQLNKSHYLETDLLEQWALGTLGAQIEVTSLNTTKGGQLIAFIKMNHFNAAILHSCKMEDN